MDLGTNTFHLLVAETHAAGFQELHHTYEAVKLGEGGINEGTIRPEAYQRGLNAMQNFRQVIDEYQPESIKAVATSALRSAGNGESFIADVNSLTGITIEPINGNEEAEYIYKAIQCAGTLSKGNNLIVDIGGGSVEFIWCSKQEIFWKQSFEIGAARLMQKFHQQDPIPADCIDDLYHYLDDQLAPLFAAVEIQHIGTFIGSSGAFETYAELIEKSKGNTLNWKESINYTFTQTELVNLFSQLAASSHQERAANDTILPVRVDMIVVTALLTKYLIDRLMINEIKMSAYSLKEGILAAMLNLI